jgi:16S rRNA processing protein RimM
MPANRDKAARGARQGKPTARRRRELEEKMSLPDDGQIEHLAIARIVAPHGLRGEVRAEVLTDFPDRFATLKTVHVGPIRQPYELEWARPHRNQVLLKLAGVDSIKQAEALRAKLVFVPRSEAVPLAEGQYFWHQIIGLEVHTTDGHQLGRIADILSTGANDVYVVRSKRGEVLIPAIEDVVKDIDLARGRMTVAPIPGMLE